MTSISKSMRILGVTEAAGAALAFFGGSMLAVVSVREAEASAAVLFALVALSSLMYMIQGLMLWAASGQFGDVERERHRGYHLMTAGFERLRTVFVIDVIFLGLLLVLQLLPLFGAEVPGA